MLTSLKVENFRCFKSFELQELGRINLLVGENNCGKTSILEAVRIFINQGSPFTLAKILTERGEVVYVPSTSPERTSEAQLDIKSFFEGRRVEDGSAFLIKAIEDGFLVRTMISIKNHDIQDPDEELLQVQNKALNILLIQSLEDDHVSSHKKYDQDRVRALGLSSSLNLEYEVLKNYQRRHPYQPNGLILDSNSFDEEEMLELFNNITLNPEEDILLEALRIIEPRVERLAASLVPIRLEKETSQIMFYIRLSDLPERVSIGSLGEGMWRVMALILALVNSRNGTLLVDDIDTGLHYTVMRDIWKLVWDTARKLNVQIFATTHNSDCWMSLAEVADEEDTTEDKITIHRIEKGASQSVMFDEEEMAIAAEQGIEVR